MANKRQKRVADQVREVLSELISLEARDPRLAGVTIMDVTIDRELMYADVYVSSLDGEDARTDVMQALDSAHGYLRRELGRRVRLQRTPELRFAWDESIAYGEHIETLLDSLLSSSPLDDDDESIG
jgi:ribosome-binding factor A